MSKGMRSRAWSPLRQTPLSAAMAADGDIPAKGEAPAPAYGFSECWRNDQYQVLVRRFVNRALAPEGVPMTHLSVKRLDKEPWHDWRHMQRIKNQLCGPDRYGFEVYPPEQHLVDATNQYHLWVIDDPSVALPIGWFGDRTLGTAEIARAIGAAQRDPEEVDGPVTVTPALLENARAVKRSLEARR